MGWWMYEGRITLKLRYQVGSEKRARLDIFLTSTNLSELITGVGMDPADNLSDHDDTCEIQICPILLLDLILAKVRGNSISYSAKKKYLLFPAHS